MALFQKKPLVGSSVPLYTLGLQKSLLIVGLGNIGEEYDGTRHNIGFECIDSLAKTQSFDDWTNKKDLKCLLASGNIGDTRVILCKPTTYMNNSGEAVRAVSNFYKIESSNIAIVHDDLDIDFGQIRTKIGGGTAGHNGLKSLVAHLGEDFGRIRIGIGPKNPPQIDSADFVLGRFTDSEQAQIDNLTKEVNAILTEFIYGGQINTETRSFLL